MNDTDLQRLIDTAWKRRLTEEEQAALRAWCLAHPQRRSEIEADLALAESVRELPDVPVPSNFVAQVWSEIEQSEAAESRASRRRSGPVTVSFWDWRAWMPRLALGSLVVAVTFGGWWRYSQSERRLQVASGLERVSAAAAAPDPGMLREFDAIQVLSEASAPVDVELLAALQ